MELLNELISLVRFVIDLFLRLDVHLNNLVVSLGPWMYVLLFAVIFAETGLVVMPLLPGDSLLFAAGALTALDGSPLNIYLLTGLLIVAAILGDACNYAIGYRVGPKIFSREDSIFLNKKHLDHTREFYDKYGGKTVILARFIPIVRTFAPFVAGIGKLGYTRFATYNVTGALLWVIPFLWGGYWLGNMPSVKSNFHYIIVAIIVISVAPAVIEVIRARRSSSAAAAKV